MNFFMQEEFGRRVLTGTLLVGILFFAYFFLPAYILSIILGLILLLILIFEWPKFKMPLLTPFYPIIPFLLLILLNQGELREIFFPLLFIIVFAYDTGAYFIGNLLGQHKLWAAVSPQKTWEGVAGGILLAFGCAYLFLKFKGCIVDLGSVFLIAIILSGAAIVGDLFESFLKRKAGIKDAGKFLPGHGGLLDRFDGILGAVLILYPFRFYILEFVGKCFLE